MLRKNNARVIAWILLAAILLTFAQPLQVQAATDAKVHYLTLPSNTLSVLVECNGQFGMIDSGEDTDYPDGSDPRYPDRAHTTKGIGYEKEVISYLKSVGVTKDNFVFYIGTHPHSDHIGSADEVIREFTPERVYLQEYKDSYISNPNKLWDNLYIYDRMLAAARDVGAQIIQNIDASNANFTLGGALKVSIKNYGDDYKTTPTDDANDFSLGVLLEANDRSVFVGGDINNFGGDETRLLKELGHVDVLTLGHHGCYGSNSNKYVTGLDPEMLILAGDFKGVTNVALPNDKSGFDTLLEMGSKGVPLYITGLYTGELGAIVVNFDAALSTNIPADSVKTASATGVSPKRAVTYTNGIPTSVALLGDWVQDGDRWWYRHSDGTYTVSDWEKINGRWFYFDAEGWMVTGWVQVGNDWYYLEPEKGDDEGARVYGWITYQNAYYYLEPDTGKMVTGWQTIDGKTYYFNGGGAMATNTTVDGKYLGKDGVYAPAGWVTEGGKKWYRHGDGSYTVNNWEQIDGKWYFFDAEGWMATGWITWKNQKYYLNPSDGVMVTGWQTINSKTYYFNADGAMVTNTTVDGKYLGKDGAYAPAGWVTEGGRKWYRHADGSYTTNNWEMIGGKWYYFDAEGWMVTGWIKLKNIWYYLNPSNGVMVTGWNTINGKVYYFDGDGAMQTGWIQLGGKWYYQDASGARVTGWIQLDGTWYYLYSNGVMAANTWVDGCYLDSSGAWVK